MTINRHDRKRKPWADLPENPIKIIHCTNPHGDSLHEFHVYKETPKLFVGRVVTGDRWDKDRDPRRVSKKSNHFHDTPAAAIEYLANRKLQKIEFHKRELETARKELIEINARAALIEKQSNPPTNETP